VFYENAFVFGFAIPFIVPCKFILSVVRLRPLSKDPLQGSVILFNNCLNKEF